MTVLMRAAVLRNGAGHIRRATALCAAALVATTTLGGCADQARYTSAHAEQAAPYRVAGPLVARPRAPASDQACDATSLTFVDVCSSFARYNGP